MKSQLLIGLLVAVVSIKDEIKAIEAEFNNQDEYYDKYGNDYVEKNQDPEYQNNDNEINDFQEQVNQENDFEQEEPIQNENYQMNENYDMNENSQNQNQQDFNDQQTIEEPAEYKFEENNENNQHGFQNQQQEHNFDYEEQNQQQDQSNEQQMNEQSSENFKDEQQNDYQDDNQFQEEYQHYYYEEEYIQPEPKKKVRTIHAKDYVQRDQIKKGPGDGHVFRDRQYHHFEKKPDFWEYLAYFPDMMFELTGNHHVPHTMRYAIGLFLVAAPLWTLMFVYCLIDNPQYTEPGEEEQFQKRFKKAQLRKKQIYEQSLKIKLQ